MSLRAWRALRARRALLRALRARRALLEGAEG